MFAWKSHSGAAADGASRQELVSGPTAADRARNEDRARSCTFGAVKSGAKFLADWALDCEPVPKPSRKDRKLRRSFLC
jgi:hypothetical protein